MKKTILTIALTMVMCFAIVGTTFAWLVAKTPSITNTFTVGDVSITLAETTGNEYKLIPGKTYKKDPKVTVSAGSEACWLFIEAAPANNLKDYVTYEIADGWTELIGVDGVNNVYYREVSSSNADQIFGVLEDDQVTVKSTLTKANLTGIKTPSLTFTAYAVQKDNITTAQDAWAQATNTANYPADTTT